MTVPVILDARILAYNDTGISRYVRHLYRAMRTVVDQAIQSGATPPVDVTVVESRRETRHHLSQAWPDTRVAMTPPHHRLERWALAAEIGAQTCSLLGAKSGNRRGRFVVHSPDHVMPERIRLLRGNRWRSVVTVHDLSFIRLPETHTSQSRTYYAGIHSTVRNADAIICPSHSTANDLFDLTRANPNRIWVIPEAADPRYRPRVSGDSATTDVKPYILTVGTIEPRKNFKTLVEAIVRIPPRQRPNVKIVGAKGAGYADLARQIASLGLDNDVSIMGRIGTEEIVTLYQNAILSVYLSLYEGFGLPVLEAMASGCPVIASDVSSIPEVASDAAILVDPTDADAIAAAVQRVMGSPSVGAELRERGLARASLFSWDRAARQTIDAFAAVAV
jgi:glycosyltransferase involved in cell wall biosynthesis